MEGVFNQIMIQKNGWIEKRNQELTFWQSHSLDSFKNFVDLKFFDEF